MRSMRVGLLALALGALPAAGAEFTRLYNGKDLSGWHVENGKAEAWKANGDMISCVAPGGGYLTADRQYGDFELRLEYRLPPAGNSGIGIHYPPNGHPSTTGIELQLLDDDAPQYKSLKPAQYNGSLYKLVAPKARAAKKPGEWNRLEVRWQGPRITARLNGTEIQNVNVEEHTEAEAGLTPLSRRPRRGSIGLQSHGDPVDFRNIEIREL